MHATVSGYPAFAKLHKLNTTTTFVVHFVVQHISD